MTEITTQEWAGIANKVEPQNKWVIEDGVVCYLSWKQRPVDYYMPIIDDKQQLRLADYLAENGVIVYLDGTPSAYRMGADGIPEHTVREDGSMLFHTLARHKDINMCRALAVLALIKEGK